MANFCINCKHIRTYGDYRDYHECTIPHGFNNVTGEPQLPACHIKNLRGDCNDFEPHPVKETKLLLKNSLNIVSTHKEPWYLPILKWLKWLMG